ncbi:SAST synthase, partial [Halcyon senegalensis]|nr:SAST synthase [Halcyon senegalensis]
LFLLGMENLLVCLYKRPDALCRLICFSWAGGGVLPLAEWGKHFSSATEVSSVRIPNRVSHDKEPLEKDMKTIADEIVTVLLEYFQEKPFAIFGHSFGTYVSFAVALQLKEKYGLEPIHLFISASHAPHSEALLPLKIVSLSDAEEEVVSYMQILGGNAEEILQNENTKKYAIRTFREDLRILQTLSFEKTENNIPFSCDITCFSGSDDKLYDLKGWYDLTSGATSSYQLPGGHFYLLEPANEVFLTKHITKCIENAGL